MDSPQHEWGQVLRQFIANARTGAQSTHERVLSWVAKHERRYAAMALHYRDPVLATVRLPSMGRGCRDDGTGDGEEVPTHGDEARAVFLRLEGNWHWAQYLALSLESGAPPFELPAKDSKGKPIWPFTSHAPEQLLQEFARVKRGSQ